MNSFRVGIAGGYLALCVILGGASAAGAAANGLLQLLGVLLLLLHAWSQGAPAMPREGRWLVTIFLVFAAIAAVQLIPVPLDAWTGLPGREVIARSMAMIGVEPASMPMSLDPRRTAASLLWLIPPAAMFLVSTRLTRDERSWVARVLLGLAVASIVLGAFQLFGGPSSRLYFYNFTNYNRSVGFFANANHVATLLLCSLPFAVMFIARAAKKRNSNAGREGRGFIYAAIAVFVGIGIAINGSLAGYGLLIPTTIACLFLHRRSVGKRIGGRTYLIGGLATLLVVGVSTFGRLSNTSLAEKFDETNTVGRAISIPTTMEAAIDHFPLGSGLGTFRDVYRAYEPVENVTSVYVNHAHNDYSEVALELGLAGCIALLAFIAWWAARGWAVWRGEQNGAALARAGSIAIGVVLAHSLVDYPIRTTAIATVVAMAAAFMIQPPAAKSARSRGGSRRGTVRHLDADAA